MCQSKSRGHKKVQSAAAAAGAHLLEKIRDQNYRRVAGHHGFWTVMSKEVKLFSEPKSGQQKEGGGSEEEVSSPLAWHKNCLP
jgi:hypothetical protein